jgi:hypothetical protein
MEQQKTRLLKKLEESKEYTNTLHALIDNEKMNLVL